MRIKVSDLLSYVFAFLIIVLFCVQANVDFVGEKNVDVGVGVFDGAISTAIIPMVHDSIIANAFGVFGGLSNILIGVTSFNYNVFVASVN
jgi:hypothetical protein